MRAYDLIMKTRRGEPLTGAEIRFLVSGCVSGDIPDYQLSAWLMRPSFTTIAPTEIKRIPDIRRIKRYGYDTQTQRRLLITNFQQLFSASGIQSIQSHRITAVVIQ